MRLESRLGYKREAKSRRQGQPRSFRNDVILVVNSGSLMEKKRDI